MTVIPHLSGFAAAVARVEDVGVGQHAGIAVGAAGEDDDRRYTIALRHADGGTLAVSLSDSQLDRLALMLAGLVHDRPVVAPGAIGRVH
ncbi:MAG TPA: hypothetical protein VFT56_01145 [Sphingomonas sp.]|nr:hypothetical protein [Sphingomonas sp.]